MKRIALVAALASAFAAPAFAQSSVTVYGRVNTSVEYQKDLPGVADDQWAVANNASRIGFKGVEDLGGGLKADFFLEHRLNSDNGAVTRTEFWSGDAWVGLAGGFGWARLGRITSAAYYATADYVSMHNHDTGNSEDKLYDYNSNNLNKIAYTSPNFGGLVLEAQYALKETAVSDDQFELAANYDVGDLHLGAGYTKWGEDQQVAFRGLYQIGAITIGGYYQYSKLDDTCGNGVFNGGLDCAGDGERHAARLSAMYTIGATELHANVGWAGDRGDVDNSSAIQYTLGANYNLSKRTKVYAFYSSVDNDDNAQYFGNAPGARAQLVQAGIRHNF